MKSVTLGKSSLPVSRLAYGCWRIAGTWEPSAVTPAMEAAGRRAVITAMEAGYTFFDHADIYCQGVAEKIFGDVLREMPGTRECIVIGTKCGIRRAGEPAADAPYRYDFSTAHIVWSCEQSLKRLGVETVDLYQLHRPDFLCDPAEVAGAFEQLRRQGKAREFGVSNFSPSQVTMLQQACPMPLVVNQVEISLAKVDALRDGTLDQCLAQKITPMAWSPLARGKLGATTPVERERAGAKIAAPLSEALDALAKARGQSRSVIALAWLLKHPAGIVPIVGSTNPERLREATTANEIELTREEWYRLMEAAQGARLP